MYSVLWLGYARHVLMTLLDADYDSACVGTLKARQACFLHLCLNSCMRSITFLALKLLDKYTASIQEQNSQRDVATGIKERAVCCYLYLLIQGVKERIDIFFI